MFSGNGTSWLGSPKQAWIHLLITALCLPSSSISVEQDTHLTSTGLLGLHSRRSVPTAQCSQLPGGLVPVQPVPTLTSPNQLGFSSSMVLQNGFTVVINKKTSVREPEMTFVLSEKYTGQKTLHHLQKSVLAWKEVQLDFHLMLRASCWWQFLSQKMLPYLFATTFILMRVDKYLIIRES